MYPAFSIALSQAKVLSDTHYKEINIWGIFQWKRDIIGLGLYCTEQLVICVCMHVSVPARKCTYVSVWVPGFVLLCQLQ